MSQSKDTTPISAEDVDSSQVKLLGEDVLVRAVPLEEFRKSGLWVQRKAQDYLGGCFYGTVVATGPGKLVERGPSPEEVSSFVYERMTTWRDNPGQLRAQVEEFVRSRTRMERRPMDVKPGDHVAVRFGFGPEVRFRDGIHHVVGRGNSEHGHGVLAAWEPEHVHCWHETTEALSGPLVIASCACGETRAITTRLPACSSCPPGERLAEAHQTSPLMHFPEAHGGMPGAYEHGVIEDRPGDAL